MSIPPCAISAEWPEDAIKFLIVLWNEGKSTGEVAAAIGGKTRNAIIGKITRLRAQGVQLRAGRNAAAMSEIRLGWRKREPKPKISREEVGIPSSPSKPYLPDAVAELDIESDIVMPARPKRLMDPLPVVKRIKKPVRQADDPREPLYWERIEMIRAAVRRQAGLERRHVA